ncbi:uncharacterized protein LOC108107587 [Drosophila eugracilis]|uniref:uncharacterized protein LOC108107587 n=1 Tax=Drosophila eugracilis TaxID=29029 RepID=UPI0007E5D8EC|nr:uncharacterized protein LOC108107587 [Drosophila eugracilis]
MVRFLWLLFVCSIAVASPSPWGAVFQELNRNVQDLLDQQMNRKMTLIMKKLEYESYIPGINQSSVEAQTLSNYLACRYGNLRMEETDAQHKELMEEIEKLGWLQVCLRLTKKDIIELKVAEIPKYPEEFILEVEKPGIFVEVLNETDDIELRELESAIKKITDNDIDEEFRVISLLDLYLATELDLREFYNTKYFENFDVQVRGLDYLLNLSQIMVNNSRTVVSEYLYKRLAYQTKQRFVLPKDCIKAVRQNFHLASNLLYEEYSEDPAIQDVKKLFNDIRGIFLKVIENIPIVLSTEQKIFLSGKVKEFALNVGNWPIGEDHHNFVSKHYKELNTSWTDQETVVYGLYLSILKVDLTWNEYWFDTPLKMISSNSNVISVPYELLQKPFYMAGNDIVSKQGLMAFGLAAHMLESVILNNPNTIDNIKSDIEKKFNIVKQIFFKSYPEFIKNLLHFIKRTGLIALDSLEEMPYLMEGNNSISNYRKAFVFVMEKMDSLISNDTNGIDNIQSYLQNLLLNSTESSFSNDIKGTDNIKQFESRRNGAIRTHFQFTYAILFVLLSFSLIF